MGAGSWMPIGSADGAAWFRHTVRNAYAVALNQPGSSYVGFGLCEDGVWKYFWWYNNDNQKKIKFSAGSWGTWTTFTCTAPLRSIAVVEATSGELSLAAMNTSGCEEAYYIPV